MFTENELREMTVLQLRKTAKENGVVIGAGADKAGIIRKILEYQAPAETADPASAQTAVTLDMDRIVTIAFRSSVQPGTESSACSFCGIYTSFRSGPGCVCSGA